MAATPLPGAPPTTESPRDHQPLTEDPARLLLRPQFRRGTSTGQRRVGKKTRAGGKGRSVDRTFSAGVRRGGYRTVSTSGPGSGASSPAARVLVRDGVQAVSRKFLDLGGQHLGLKIKVRLRRAIKVRGRGV